MKPRKKVLQEYNLTGECIVNIPELIKVWDDQYTILKYHEMYSLIRYRKGANNGSTTLKVQIPKEQALKIIKSLKLGEIKDSLFKCASSFKSQGFIQSEIERIKPLYEKSIMESNSIRDILQSYQLATYK